MFVVKVVPLFSVPLLGLKAKLPLPAACARPPLMPIRLMVTAVRKVTSLVFIIIYPNSLVKLIDQAH